MEHSPRKIICHLKTSLDEFKMITIIESMLDNHSCMNLKIKKREYLENLQIMGNKKTHF